jgi:hypothetical protein
MNFDHPISKLILTMISHAREREKERGGEGE